MKLFLIILLSTLSVFAAEDLQKSKWKEVYNIIDNIKTKNPPRRYSIQGRAGLTQLITNSTGEPLNLGLGGNLPTIGLSYKSNFAGNWGAEAKLVYAQNLIPAEGSPNQSSSYIYWLDLGPRYTLYLDSTRLDNNLTFKILFHLNGSNMALTEPDLFFVHQYMGYSFSVERGIPITRKLGIIASLDLLQILDAKSNSTKQVTGSGYGFEVHGEIYYMIELFNKPTRLGFSYWQQGNSNDFGDDPTNSSKQFYSKNSFFQIARALFVNWTVLF
ncbi:MAG: hypothetical protein IPM57_05900 [Oligoflexia bacterium]|nr:hypothetical protein [Oligoflexia bacterium]